MPRGLHGGGGQCTPRFAGRDDGPSPNYPSLMSPESPANNLVSVHAVDLTGNDVASLLGDALNTTVRFVPVDPLQTYSIHVIDFPPDELAHALAKFGVVAAAEESRGDSLQMRAVPEAEVTIRIAETTMGVVAGLLHQLVAERGPNIRVTDPSQAFSLDVQRMPLKELLAALESMGAVKLEYGSQQ